MLVRAFSDGSGAPPGAGPAPASPCPRKDLRRSSKKPSSLHLTPGGPVSLLDMGCKSSPRPWLLQFLGHGKMNMLYVKGGEKRGTKTRAAASTTERRAVTITHRFGELNEPLFQGGIINKGKKTETPPKCPATGRNRESGRHARFTIAEAGRRGWRWMGPEFARDDAEVLERDGGDPLHSTATALTATRRCACRWPRW